MISPKDEMHLRTREIADKVKLIAKYLDDILAPEISAQFQLEYQQVTDSYRAMRRDIEAMRRDIE